ncbi:MAG: WecB/TagA/CpsF family glycosyltransferase [Ekhidna sp.]|nr:WecB/TagA/CpsF family glycosyltransferase [Ekhidna sp.]
MTKAEKVDLLGIKISNLTTSDLNNEIKCIIDEKRKEHVLNVNINAMNIAYSNKWFKDLLNSAAINFCDGDGVRLGAMLRGKKIKEKITYNKWIWALAEFSLVHGYTWYLLGGRPEVIEKANKTLCDKYPDLKILGYHHGYVDKSRHDEIIGEIKEKKPNILCLGMGMPKQERFLMEHDDDLSYNIVLTGGAVFDYVSGEFKMTPELFTRLKLEWFFRFLQQPKRLFKRYFFGNFFFLFRVIFGLK